MQVLNLLPQHCKVFPLIEKKEHFFVKHFIKLHNVKILWGSTQTYYNINILPSGGHMSR